jgi:chemotaxis protein CheX
VKARFINPFLASSMNLFKDYLNIGIKNLTPHLLKDPQNLQEVSGIIGLAGETTGAVVLSFSRETAIAVVSRFSNKPYGALTNDVLDGVGELVNIIAGNAKRDLEEFRIQISLPGVIVGSSYKIHWPDGIPVIAIPFECELGPFSVNVSLRDAV